MSKQTISALCDKDCKRYPHTITQRARKNKHWFVERDIDVARTHRCACI